MVVVGVITHAFPYEPGFVLWLEAGEFAVSGGEGCSSGELEYMIVRGVENLRVWNFILLKSASSEPPKR
jgi:hypothetical protein